MLPMLAASGAIFPILFFGVFIAIAGGVLALAFYTDKQNRQKWVQFAHNHRLVPSVDGWSNPSISGIYNGVSIYIHRFTRGSGKHSTTYTGFRAGINAPLPRGLVLEKEHFLSGVGKFFGSQDIQIGDPQLDAAFMIKGDDIAGIATFMRQPVIRNALLSFAARHSGIGLSNGNLEIEERGMVTDFHRLHSLLEEITHCARTIQSAAGGMPQTAPMPQPIELGRGPGGTTYFASPKRGVKSAPAMEPVRAAQSRVEPQPRVAPVLPDRPAPAPSRDTASIPMPSALEARLVSSDLDWEERERLVAEYTDKPVRLVIDVDRVESTNAYDVEEPWRGGKTLQGFIGGSKTKILVVFAHSRNAEVDTFKSGRSVEISLKLQAWDPLYERYKAFSS